MNAQQRTKNEERRTGGRPAAFTLIELLVVISIIAILLGITVPMFYSVRSHARYSKAKVTVKNLETAFKAYFEHYRAWPTNVFGNGGEIPIDTAIVGTLQGGNPDGIVFYEFDLTNSVTGALDPWANPGPVDSSFRDCYLLQVDYNYDNVMDASCIWGPIRRQVIVWSIGEDRSNGTSDDAKSWD